MQETEIESIISDGRILWRGHALRRMLERGITRKNIETALSNGRIIEQYPHDFPFPTCLVSGYAGDNPLQVVCAKDHDYPYIITAYVPDPTKWEYDFERRRKK